MSTHYRPDIDGLRALAIAGVVAFHAFPSTFPGGFLGVDIFFVISGFLITGIVMPAIRARTFSIVQFYLRRARRLLPALLSMLAVVSALACFILLPGELETFARRLVASALFVPNLAYARHAGYFDPSADTNVLLHLWSLGVEEQFYLVWPLLLMALLPRVSNRAFVVLLAAGVLTSLLLNLALARYSPTMAFYLPVTRFWQLLVGASLAHRVARAGTVGPQAVSQSRWRSNALSIGGVLLMVIPMVFMSEGWRTSGAVSVPATLGAALFIAAGTDGILNRTPFSTRAFVGLGLISYPLYLWHWPLLSFLMILGLSGGEAGGAHSMTAVLVSVVLAILTYRYIEGPFRSRAMASRTGIRLLGGLAVSAVAGAVLAASHGWPQRTPLDRDPFEWGLARRLDEECARRHGIPEPLREVAFCLRNSDATEADIVVIGDSHANMWTPGLFSAYPKASILQIGGSACPTLRGFEFWTDERPDRREQCPPIMEAAFASLSPRTQVVILAARHPLYTASPVQHAKAFDYAAPAHLVARQMPGIDARVAYESTLRREVAELLKSGREVVLILPLPPLDFSPTSCVGPRPVDRWRAAPGPDACTVAKTRVDEELAESRALIARVAEDLAGPSLYVVDPAEALCDDKRCRALQGRKPLYRDDDHLSVFGSQSVWMQIKPGGSSRLLAYD